MYVLDFHAHAWPDALAVRTVPSLVEAAAGIPDAPKVHAYRGGTVADLLASMDRSGINTSVLASIATRPGQTANILEWCTGIAESTPKDIDGRPRLVPFPSVHPADPEAGEWVRRIAERGFRGIKLHPYWQNFRLDDPGALAVLDACADRGLAVLCHCGHDIGWPRDGRAAPELVARICGERPDLQFVAAHLGGWDDWESSEHHLAGTKVWLDTAFSLHLSDPATVRRILEKHGADRILFGTDTPWTDQAESRREAETLMEEIFGNHGAEKVMGGNALRLLGL